MAKFNWRTYEFKSGMKVRHRETKQALYLQYHTHSRHIMDYSKRLWEASTSPFYVASGTLFTVHEADLIPIRIVKKPRREWWINEKRMRSTDGAIAAANWADWFETPNGNYISTIRPENTDGWILVKEVVKK